MNNQPPKTAQEIKEKITSFQNGVLVKNAKKSKLPYSLNIIIMILSDLLSGVLVGAGIGYLLYKLFAFHLLIVAVFVLLGGLAGFSNLYKSLNRLQKGIEK